MVQADKMNIIRNTSNTLVSMCIKYVGRNINLYKNDECFIKLPKHLKINILRFITRCLQEIHLDAFQILLNNQVTVLNLVSFDINDDLLFAIAKQCPKLRTLYFKGSSKDLSNEGLNQIAKLIFLEKLEVLNCNLVNDNFVKNISSSCTMLSLLSIPDSQISDDSFYSLRKIKLRNLNISKTKITDEFVKNLSESEMGKNLEELNISNNSNVTNKGLCHLPWENLKYVSFHGCDTDETLFDTIQPSTKFMVWSIPS